jgi:CRP-like cAMP-binding protein
MVSPELLRRYPHFAGVSEESLRHIAMISEERNFHAGAVVVREGEPASHLFVVSHGEVDVQSVLADGEHKTVDTLVPGDLLVWSALVEPHLARFWAVARSDAAVIAIEADSLRELMERDHRLGHRLMTGIAVALSHRLVGARIQLAAH